MRKKVHSAWRREDGGEGCRSEADSRLKGGWGKGVGLPWWSTEDGTRPNVGN